MSKHRGHRNPWPPQKTVQRAETAPPRAKAVVMVATPTYTGQLVHQYLTSYIGSFSDCYRNGIVLAPDFAVGFSLVQYARDWLVYRFLASPEFTHLMWVDSDLGWERTAIRRLVEADKDIIGGSYTTKDPVKPTYPFVALGPIENGVQQVSSLPGGFILMSRQAVQALADASPQVVMEHGGVDYVINHVCDLELVTVDKNGNHVRRMLGEDYVMQVKLQSLGFKMYLQTDIDFVHVGPIEFYANVAKAYAAEQERGLKTMWHPDAWRPIPQPDPRSDAILCVPEEEVPTPHLLDHLISPQEPAST